MKAQCGGELPGMMKDWLRGSELENIVKDVEKLIRQRDERRLGTDLTLGSEHYSVIR